MEPLQYRRLRLLRVDTPAFRFRLGMFRGVLRQGAEIPHDRDGRDSAVTL